MSHLSRPHLFGLLAGLLLAAGLVLSARLAGDTRVARACADRGVFQITPLHGVQTSWEGVSDTSSLDKTITAVVTATFSLE